MGFDVLDSLPGQGAAGAFGEGNVKQFVIALERIMVVPPSGVLLHLKEIVDPLPALLIE
jgi:hypothetical protein